MQPAVLRRPAVRTVDAIRANLSITSVAEALFNALKSDCTPSYLVLPFLQMLTMINFLISNQLIESQRGWPVGSHGLFAALLLS
jgi:hypothetical protein